MADQTDDVKSQTLSEQFAKQFAQLRRPLTKQFAEMVRPASLDLPEIQIPRYRIPTQAEAHDYDTGGVTKPCSWTRN